jgi:hypothetical protein
MSVPQARCGLAGTRGGPTEFVKNALPDVLIVYRHTPHHRELRRVEIAARFGEHSEEAGSSGNAAGRRCVVDGAERAPR